jgi:rhamnogalacturonyl hydrolase YesR
MKNRIALGLCLLAVAVLFSARAAPRAEVKTPASLTGFAANADPRAVGVRVVENLLERHYRTNKPAGYIVYPEICAAFGALRFTDATGDTNLEQKLIARYAPVLLLENARLIPPPGHVDNNVFGVLPLEIFRLNGDTNFLALGLKLADRQWKNPLTNGLTRETRWWVDDAYMIGSLQIQAYRVTHDEQYADRVTTQLAAYLDRLQLANGLFHHGPDAPYFWGRGNGWVAASLAEVLQSLPPSYPQYARLMAGYRKMMAGLKATQGADGLWHQLVDDPQSWAETSGSGMFTYALIVGVKHGWLDAADYGDAARRGWLALCGKLDARANLLDICAGTNQNADRQFYLDRPRIAGDLHGQAPLLWCAWALLEK